MNWGQRPSLRLHATTVATLVWWVMVFIVMTYRETIDGGPHLHVAAAARRGLVMTGAVIYCVLVGRLLRWRETTSWARMIPRAAAVIICGALIQSLAAELIGSIGLEPMDLSIHVGNIVNRGTFVVFFYAAWCGLFLAIASGERIRDQELGLARAEALAADAQTRMLRYQINPHFLFNTLNAISSLVLKSRNAEAERMLSMLSAFLRQSLYSDANKLVSVRDEIQIQRHYLEIEQVRFPSRVVLKESVEAEAADAMVPNFILQPLVENCIRHGVAATRRAVTIEIEARAADGRLLLAVRDDGRDSDEGCDPEPGIGLANVRQRIAALYGARGEVDWRVRRPRGFEVLIRLPLEAR